MHKTRNWDDLRFVLAVAEAGSVNAASTGLGVNHATVLRRIAGFEARYGIKVFDRSAKGYRTTGESARLIAAAKQVEQAYSALERLVSGDDDLLRGTVRLTTTDSLSSAVLPELLAEFHRIAPDILIELQTTNAHLNLSRLDADLTVRPARVLPDDLSGTVAAKLGFGVYGLRDLLGRTREVGGIELPWLAGGVLLQAAPPGRWMEDHVPTDAIVARADSFVSLYHMARQGMGLALLPCCLADQDDRLIRLNAAAPEVEVNIWVATHRDMAKIPRILAVQRFLITALKARQAYLYGNY